MRPSLIALDTLNRLNSAGTKSGYQVGQSADAGVVNVIIAVINMALALTGVIFLAFLVYAGYIWMIAHGNSDQVEKAKSTITHAVIGLAIVLASYAISNFVVPAIVSATMK
jgi:hypothetical protein